VTRVLVVDDEPQIRRALATNLRARGYEVDLAADGEAGLALAARARPDVVVLDLGLPDGDGVDFIHDLRGWSTVPVIVLSARSSESDKIAALDAGADDYLLKPFGVGELLARVRAQLRRHAQQTPAGESVVRFGEVSIDMARRSVERSGAPVHLTPMEYRLLTHLASQPDRVVTHRQLLKAVWGAAHVDQTHYVRVHMANLRKKIERDPSMPRHLVTEAGVGYRFVAGSNP
jgi:two-component system KDP operon response regulator KdpE